MRFQEKYLLMTLMILEDKHVIEFWENLILDEEAN